MRQSAASAVASLFAAQARNHPERTAIEDGARRLTYGALDRRTLCLVGLAGPLAMRGVERGSRVAIVSENRLEYLELLIAAARLGAIVTCQN